MMIYFFNIDILYVIKARLFLLEKKLKEELQTDINQGNFYTCPAALLGKCTFNLTTDVVDEIRYETGQKRCTKCRVNLVINKKTSIDDTIKNGCYKVIENIKTDLDTLKNYRIPP